MTETDRLGSNAAEASVHSSRVVVFDVQPTVDGGRYAPKRVVGDRVVFGCDLVLDGHDAVAGVVRVAAPASSEWREVPLVAVGNDRFEAQLGVDAVGRWRFRIDAWVDTFATWRHGLMRKHEAGQDVSLELAGGASLVRAAAERALERASGEPGVLQDAARWLGTAAEALERGPTPTRVASALSSELAATMNAFPDRRSSSHSAEYAITVDPPRGRFSSWYELFPRSFGKGGKHGTFEDVRALLPYVASMGFDVLYLPPIHPIGLSHRKGPNNSLEASENDPGSPWAIGGKAGGHKEIHPELGSVGDFRRLVAAARDQGIEVAIDVAFQASPDHPYVAQHPEWFLKRADGSIQYAENPPKKYQDVYPFDLSGPSADALWKELLSVFEVWIERGVRIFRVDNPHTKPLAFWEYCITRLKHEHPDVLFLAEAFTRPKLMYALAKLGFSQSYTYFTWRTTADELKGYLNELTRTPVAEFFRPNFWPNTPDILPEHLQYGGRPTFISRMVLAGTLSASWGIYGPCFELMEHVARPGAEEYVDNEKYQLRSWDLDRSDSLRHVIARFNSIRRENPALHGNSSLRFHHSDDDSLLVYSKTDDAAGSVVLVVVNLDPRHTHSAWLDLDLAALRVAPGQSFQAHDLLSDARYLWSGSRVYVEVDPHTMPAHVFKIRTRVRSERNFEYYL